MKTKFTMFRRGAMFYMQDSATGKQTSLRTKDEAEATRCHGSKSTRRRHEIKPVITGHLRFH